MKQLKLDLPPPFGEHRAPTQFGASETRHATLYQRLVKLSAQPDSEQGCWTWRGMVKGRYPRLNIRTSAGKHKQIRAHRAMAVLMEVGEEVELFWDLYELYSVAGFEGDHLCEGNPLYYVFEDETSEEVRSFIYHLSSPNEPEPFRYAMRVMGYENF